jgi:hypothetical protein
MLFRCSSNSAIVGTLPGMPRRSNARIPPAINLPLRLLDSGEHASISPISEVTVMALDQAPTPPAPPTAEPDPLAGRYPAVPLAYEFVRRSYELMAKRFEIVEGRIRALLTLALTMTFGAPIFVNSAIGPLSFTSLWFRLAVAAAVLSAVLGVAAHLWGSLMVFSPRLLYDRTLHLPDWEFKRNALYRAGEAFEVNAAAVERKARIGVAMAVLLLVELLLLVAWAFLPP